MPRDVGVVVVAAGRGVRAGGTLPKQFREIAGVPLLLRALRPFAAHPSVAHITVVLPAGDVGHPPSWLAELTGGTLSLTAGGAERSDSVRAGLAALPAACTIVLVHDGARPFPDRALIDGVIAAARKGDGAIPAIPVGDTLKAAKVGEVLVERTVPREGLWRAQTPQGFPRRMLERAYARAGSSAASDDASLVEADGGRVVIVPGSARNLKVTTAEDFELGELIAAGSR